MRYILRPPGFDDWFRFTGGKRGMLCFCFGHERASISQVKIPGHVMLHLSRFEPLPSPASSASPPTHAHSRQRSCVRGQVSGKRGGGGTKRSGSKNSYMRHEWVHTCVLRLFLPLPRVCCGYPRRYYEVVSEKYSSWKERSVPYSPSRVVGSLTNSPI